MKYLWNYIDKKNWTEQAKYKVLILILCSLSALAGLLAWLLLGRLFLPGFDWLFCFIGYPIVITIIAVFLYSCRHNFH